MTPEPSSQLTCLDAGDGEPRQLTDTEFAAVAKALGNVARLKILESFSDRCPRRVGEIASSLPLAQSTVSEHLRMLRDAGLLHTLRGAQTWHCLNRSVLRGFIERVDRIASR